MTDLRNRILEVIGESPLHDLSEAALVEILIAQLKEARQDLINARNAIFKEGLRADDIQRSAHEEIRQLRINPLAAAHGDFYFCGVDPNTTYIVSIGGHRNIQMYRRTGHVRYVMAQISPEEYAKRN